MIFHQTDKIATPLGLYHRQILVSLETDSGELMFHYKCLFPMFEKQTPKPSNVKLKHSFWDLPKIYNTLTTFSTSCKRHLEILTLISHSSNLKLHVTDKKGKKLHWQDNNPIYFILSLLLFKLCLKDIFPFVAMFCEE